MSYSHQGDASDRVFVRPVQASLRIPPPDQRAAKTIKRLWMGGDDTEALVMLGDRVDKYMGLFWAANRGGRDEEAMVCITLARWYIDTAPPEMRGLSDPGHHGQPIANRIPMVPRPRRAGRVAGEVRFIKDRGGDHNEWGWNPPNSNERDIDPDYKFDAKNLKPVAATLRSALMALGHIQTARSIFTKIRSQRISPDGNIGGKGYVMPIKDIRKQLANCDEALSAVTDSLYDEMQAVHWHPDVDGSGGNPRERGSVKKIMDDIEEIRDDPEEWAEGEESDMDDAPTSKVAAVNRLALRWISGRAL